MEENRICENCIWCESCGKELDEDCDDFTPYSDRLEVAEYENDLKLRHDTYQKMVKDYAGAYQR